MAWRYPPQYIGPKYVADISPINENLSTLAGEVSGMLNEHNLRASEDTSESLLTRAQLENDAAFRIKYVTANPIPIGDDYGSRTNWATIAAADGWQTFTDDGCQIEFVAVGGLVWLNASFSVVCGFGVASKFQKGYGYNFALELDGVIVYESLVGSGESASEFYNGPNGRGARLTPIKSANLVTPVGGGGVSAARIAMVVDAIVNVPPGPHTVRIAIMNIRGKMQRDPVNSDTFITNREMFVMELMR